MIQKILNVEEVSYSSDLSEETLKRKIKDLFEQKSFTTDRFAYKQKYVYSF